MLAKEIRFKDKIKDNRFFRMQLIYLGLNRKYTGFYYLVELLHLTVNLDLKSDSYYKEVYPIIGEYFDVSDKTIERNIRYILKMCWNEQMATKLRAFWIKDRCPTCRKFILILRDYIIDLVNQH